ncbi:MAG: hypothetical protein NT046_03405 [Arenimonas sp.]|nr:hypothetical protein [Arenimonas sp.]
MTVTLDGNELRGRLFRRLVWGGAAFLLLLPAVAMLFTEEMNWTAADFIVWGVMLLVACVSYEIAARIARSNAYMAAAGVAVAGGFLMTWVNLAVGIIGNENNPANEMFFWVIAVAIIGALLVLFRARGMVWVMSATALAQLAVCLYAWFAGLGWIFVFTGVMCTLWIASARLFHHAAKTRRG